MESINITPNFNAMFRVMLAETKEAMFRGMLAQAKIQGDSLDQHEELAALRAFQRFFAPLTIALNCATTAGEINELRAIMADALAVIDRRATELEGQH